jgi:hypothetical protein
MLKDGADETWSSKRVVTFSAFVFCSIAFFANLFFNLEVNEYMFQSMMMIVIGGLGVTVTERFADKNSEKNKYNKRIKGRPLPKYHQEEL